MLQIIRALRHLVATVLLTGFGISVVLPAIADVTTESVCPEHRDECSLAFYLIGFQQAITGLGATILTPWIGGLSDKYGRKNLLTLPILLSVIPSAILAYERTPSFFYAYYVTKTLSAVLTDGSLLSLALAYTADKISPEQRISAFGIVSGTFSASFLCGSLAARFLSVAAIFQASMCASLVATVYMRVFLEESVSDETNLLSQPIVKMEEEGDGGDDEVPKLAPTTFKTIPSPMEVIKFLRRSSTFSRTATAFFLNNVVVGWSQSSLLYYLKARFHSNKDQFSSLLIIIGGLGAISQWIVTSSLSALIGDKKLLSLALFASYIQMLILSVIWSFWVAYVAAAFFLISWCVIPATCSIASKQVDGHEQGKAQGCIFGLQSFAHAISPLAFNPLVALFLSENPPFHFPGFTLLCLSFITLIAFALSLTIKVNPSISS